MGNGGCGRHGCSRGMRWLVVYLIYRWVISLFFQIWLFLAGFHPYNGGPKFFIFLTNWSFLVFNAYLLWSAISVTLSYLLANFTCKKKYDDLSSNNFGDEEENEEKYGCRLFYRPVGCCGKTRDGTVWYQKIQWFLFNISTPWAIAVTILYWALLRTGTIDGVNLTTHLVNGIVALIDVGVTRIPVRILHIFYSVTAAIIYLVFTGIYFAAGGTNTRGDPYIYSVIDYGSNPSQSTGLALAVALIYYPIMFLIFYGLFLLREGFIFLVKKACFKNREEHQEVIEMDTA